MELGSGILELEKLGDRTRVRRAQAKSPFRFLTAGNPGPVAWVFLTSYGGGLVAGDSIDLQIEVDRAAEAMLLTQSSTKVYRANRGRGSRQTLRARVKEEGVLMALPDPVTCFRSASFRQEQEYRVSSRGSLLLVDTVSCGRHGSGECWDFDYYCNQIRILRDEVPVFRESLLLSKQAAGGDVAGRCAPFHSISLIVLLGPAFSQAAKALLGAYSARPLAKAEQTWVAVSPLGDDGAVLRIASPSVEEGSRAIRGVLSFLPERLQENPWTRKGDHLASDSP